MAEIPGVVIDWVSTPRIIYIPLAIRTVSAQDLVDTLRAIESGLDALDDVDPLIYEATGKTALDDSGTVVGITVVLLNAQLYFIPDTTPISSGTATSNTSASGRAIQLVDSTATFQTDLLQRGQTIFNATTGAMATIISVLSETTLESVFLTGGTRATWLIGDQWVSYNQQQCSIEGGNVVAIDDAVLQNLLTPVLESPNTQVVRSSSSSATLQELSSIQYSSFNGGVTIQVGSANSGTAFPVGTPEYPVNNLADADSIADAREFNTFFVQGNLTIGSGNFSDGHVFIGQSTSLTTLTVQSLADVTNCEFRNATVTGVLDGGCTLNGCIITTLSYVSGYVTNCTLAAGTITLGGGVAALFINCQSGVPGTSTPTIDMGGSGQSLAIRGYNGGIKLANRTGVDAISIDMNSGQVIVDSTVTDGHVTIRGITKVVDNSTGTAVVDSADAIVPARVTALTYQLESLGLTKPRYGTVYYWDPVDGDDAHDGTGPTRAVLTFAAAQVLCVSGRGDTVFIVSNSHTTLQIDERLVITKNDISIRGPGRSVKIKPSVANIGDTITISADNVELSNFIVEAATGATTDNAITVNGRACLIQHMWINRANYGIHLRGGDYHKVLRCDIEIHTNGIVFTDAGLASGSPREVLIDSCFIYLSVDGIHLTGTSGNSTRLNRFLNCKVSNNSEYGLRIDANVQDTLIDSTIFQNTLGQILDAGTRTTIANSTNPWALPTSGNEAAGTMGERVKQIKNLTTLIPATL